MRLETEYKKCVRDKLIEDQKGMVQCKVVSASTCILTQCSPQNLFSRTYSKNIVGRGRGERVGADCETKKERGKRKIKRLPIKKLVRTLSFITNNLATTIKSSMWVSQS